LRKVLVCITARPSYSRIKSALVALKARPDVTLQIVCAASAVVTRFGRIADQIRADGFEVNAEVSSVVEDDSLSNSALSTGVLLTQLTGIFAALKPDVVVTIADRHETLATAIAASYQHIPLCHIQGGEVTGSIDDKVRNAVTQLADIHCVATERAGSLVCFVGKDDRTVHVTGCPSIDLAAEALKLGPRKVADVIVLQHPVTTEMDQAGAQMRATIEAVGKSALYFWPGEDSGAQAMSKELRLAGIKPVRNLPPLEFLRVLLGAQVLVGNSSVGIRECSFLGVPVVNIGTRQAGRERGPNVWNVPYDEASIFAAMRFAAEPHRKPARSTLYGDGHAGKRIAGILAGKAAEAAA
jgi:UDP-hydrolysing UDP-N-acetyl-D-glucosamine 2-epimerase